MTTNSQPTPPSGRPPLRPVGEDGRPRVRIGADPDAIRVLIEALNNRLIPDTYVTDGTAVVVEAVSGAADPTATDETVPLPLVATSLTPALLTSLLACHAEVVRTATTKGESRDEEVSPSREVLSAVLAPQSWPGLPVLRRIISTPVLRADGTLLQTPGYDPATGFYLTSRRNLDPVPEHPTPGQVAAAREFLLGRFLRDFPWRDRHADRANYLGLLVTPIIRPFTRALSPFGLIEASMPGSGKSILTGCVGLLVGQQVLTWSDKDEELRKQITSVLADQVGVVVYDNLEEGTTINSAVLARLLTERTWSDRRLNTNTTASYPNDRLWLATGNNIRVGGDLASRSVWVRLDPDCPRPEARTGFAIEHLDDWILQPANQATVLWHLLVLILDWTAAGAPLARTVPTMRQFTKWAQHVGGFLDHHGVPGFLGNADTARDLDEDAGEWEAFLATWHHVHGDRKLTAQQLVASAQADIGPDPWQGTFPTTAAGKPLSVKSLGRRLTGQLGRWRNTVVLRSVKDEHDKMRRYWVEIQDADTPPRKQTPQTPQTPPHAADEDEWAAAAAVFGQDKVR